MKLPWQLITLIRFIPKEVYKWLATAVVAALAATNPVLLEPLVHLLDAVAEAVDGVVARP